MRRLAVFLVCALLSACFTGGKRGGDTALSVYDFGPPPGSLLAVPRPSPLALEVRAPLWFDTLGIDYRLAYVDAARLREYARARWAGPPAQLIQQRLQQQLGYSMAGQGPSACLLRLDINEFSQVFTRPDSSEGVLKGRAILLDKSRRQLAQLDIEIRKLAGSQDARGGVAALSATVEQLAGDLLTWEQEQGSGLCPR